VTAALLAVVAVGLLAGLARGDPAAWKALREFLFDLLREWKA
jgi:hypothetical protein